VPQAKITDDAARQIALSQAAKDAGNGVSVQITTSARYIFNKKSGWFIR